MCIHTDDDAERVSISSEAKIYHETAKSAEKHTSIFPMSSLFPLHNRR